MLDEGPELERRREFSRLVNKIRLDRSDRPGVMMTQTQLAKMLGVEPQTVSTWVGKKAGYSSVDPLLIESSNLTKLAKLYGCGLREFLGLIQGEDQAGVAVSSLPSSRSDNVDVLLDQLAGLPTDRLANVVAGGAQILANRLKNSPVASSPNPQPSTPASRIAYLLNKDMQRQGLSVAEYATEIGLPEPVLGSLLKGSLPITDQEALLKSLVSVHVDDPDGGKRGLLSLRDWEDLIGYKKCPQIRSTLRVSTTLIKAPSGPP